MMEFVYYVLIGGVTAFGVSMITAPITGRLWRRHYQRMYVPFPVGTMVQWNDAAIQNDHTDRVATVTASLYFTSETKEGQEVALEFVCGCLVMGVPVSALKEVKSERHHVLDILRSIRGRIGSVWIRNIHDDPGRPTP
jgi:hypothetical protein